MTKFRRYLCNLICGHREFILVPREEVPFEIREASHRISNATMELQASAATVKQEADAFTELARALQPSKGGR